jgi:Cysteine rich repeat
MRSTSKSIGSGVGGFVALAAFASNASAQLQGPNQGSPQVQSESAKPSPLRDVQQMIEAQRSQMQSRVAAAAERIQNACRTELQNFCSTVTPGEGRLLLCMQAHEDKLGNQCQLALFEASRNIQQAARRVERVADACWSDIQTHCGGDSSIVQCMNEKRSLLSPACQAAVAELRPASQQASSPQQQQRSLAGLPIYSSDGVKVGEVSAVKTGLDGRPQMIQAEMGSLLGLGTNTVLITPDELEARSDGLQLRLSADQIRSVLQEQR